MEDGLIHILLIEDNPGDARLVKEMLVEGETGSFHLSHAERLTEGISRLKEDDFQVVLLDLSLPDGQGLNTINQVCTQAPHIPVIILTGLDDETLAIRAVQAGAQDYLVKGLMDHNLLKRSIRYGLERKKTEEGMRALQEQLRQSQKMEAIGHLAGGVAHDFNNLLTVIIGYSDSLLSQLQPQDLLWAEAMEIRRAAERSALLTHQLLAFSRKQMLQPKILDLNDLITNMDKMLRRLISENIYLTTHLSKDLGKVKTDPGQIEQVVMNIVVNARDAMPLGGRLTIETDNVELDEYYAQAHMGVRPGRYSMIAISDTGTGMSSEIRERIFEPFFTTKEVGQGTGLGLSTAYGIVKQSGGNIWVYSELGKGTTFKIYLPRVDEDVGLDKHRFSANKPTQGSETILLVEDEEIVRRFAHLLLQKNGYRLLEASNGEEALRIVHEQKDNPIHLLMTDVVMPGMSGRELADSLASLRPKMKVLFMSGYTEDALMHQGVKEEQLNFIQKPFTGEEIMRKIRKTLDGDIVCAF